MLHPPLLCTGGCWRSKIFQAGEVDDGLAGTLVRMWLVDIEGAKSDLKNTRASIEEYQSSDESSTKLDAFSRNKLNTVKRAVSRVDYNLFSRFDMFCG